MFASLLSWTSERRTQDWVNQTMVDFKTNIKMFKSTLKQTGRYYVQQRLAPMRTEQWSSWELIKAWSALSSWLRLFKQAEKKKKLSLTAQSFFSRHFQSCTHKIIHTMSLEGKTITFNATLYMSEELSVTRSVWAPFRQKCLRKPQIYIYRLGHKDRAFSCLVQIADRFANHPLILEI